MTPESILELLWAQGFTVCLVERYRLAVSPASTLQDSQRELLRANKAAIVAALREADSIIADLLKAAMLACDHHGDNPAAREAMCADCLATPPHLRADLLAHFKQTYRGQA
ncbi:hypothetical protein [Polaromonas sp. JS666]|uniref:hypothetical protein n=1 Tax=Polaromonas sp. (strain JS666 / ATCC BAA-500) TaxID=296591 RepID=UPI0000463F0F|nr:hypothetical protein [Polaromonas sp. JS666]ABE44884.1 hypothetical protein Bpro_2970 [Polaromonas sp. JS666]